eukprot:gb/GECG01008376.1/.p1 GENE.gb/GECG01008376.1/~~gb/GECG01008376.1/.p1  ORF type:complete len:289 (+),score=28.02 gb/GECG01008376.1/:1-867(+)
MASILSCVILTLWFLVAGSHALSAKKPYEQGERHIMPWLCLSRCGLNDTQIKKNMNQVLENRQLFDFASFEKFNLGPNSTLVDNNFTKVGIPFIYAGIYTVPMVSSYPYPKNFLDWMRTVFANPTPFMMQVLGQAHRYSAVNIDWEPTTNNRVTPQDAVDYANFLNKLAQFLHQYSMQVTVDVSTWSPIWNLELIGKTDVDWIVTMSTYTDNQATWMKEFQYAVEKIPIEKLIIGLETVKSDGSPYSSKVLEERFQQLETAGIRGIGLWRSPIPDVFFPFLKKYKGIT